VLEINFSMFGVRGGGYLWVKGEGIFGIVTRVKEVYTIKGESSKYSKVQQVISLTSTKTYFLCFVNYVNDVKKVDSVHVFDWFVVTKYIMLTILYIWSA